MKSSFIMFGIAGMLLMAACSTSNYTQKTSSDDLYSPNASSAPAIHHTQTNTSSSDQVIDPPVIVDRSEDQTPLDDNSSDGYNNNGSNDNGYNNGYNNGYEGYNSYNGSSWDNSAMDRMGYASSSFGFYGPAYSGFTMYSPLYYSPGFSMSLGFSFGSSMFYSPMWNSYAWMPPPPPPMYYAPVYPYYPYSFGMYGPMCMNPYAYMDPYGYYGGLYNNYYYGGYYPSYYSYNQYYGPRNSTSSNSASHDARVYTPGRSSNPVPSVNNNRNHGYMVAPSVRHPQPLNGNNGTQMQESRRYSPPPVAPSAPRTAPSNNTNSGHPKNEFRPLPQAFETEQQPAVINRNNLNHEARPQNTEGFHQMLNEENKSRNIEQHPVQPASRNSSNSSSNNSPHANGNRQYR